jgi:head-tail adaptor
MTPIGRFTERLAFSRNTVTVDAQGGRGSAWATFATIWGRVMPLTGRESMQAASVSSLVAYRAQVAAQQLEAASVSVSSITRSGSTATVTTSASHGLVTGDYTRISGATEEDYNGQFSITKTNATVFTYAVANAPSTPAGGTKKSVHILPISPKLMRIAWVPSWDSGHTAFTLQIHAVRMVSKSLYELDLGETS